MDYLLERTSFLWTYLSPEQKDLITDGEQLIADCQEHPKKLSDYSYLVFPWAKAYEGFLKQLLRDLGIISQTDWRSDHFRIGKVLSPALVFRLKKRSAYFQLEKRFGSTLADVLWDTWKQARNLVFHYFPHNYRALSYDQARSLIQQVTRAMEQASEITRPVPESHDRRFVGSYQVPRAPVA